MRNHSKKRNYCLIAALASLVAFSTMAASVMSGCGEDSDNQKTTEIVHETRIDTQVETKIETYTEVVTDAQGNTEYVEETKAVAVNNNNAGANNGSNNANNNSNKNGNSASSNSNSSNKNSKNQQSSVIEKSETSKSDNSSSKTDTSKSDSSSNNNSSSKSDTSKSDSNSKTLKIGGKTFNVGDTIVCTYNLTTPTVLENYQAEIDYDSSKLTCKSAKMAGEAKNGAMLNKNIAGSIRISGVNIGDGYDYTSGGTFLTVTYIVKEGGSTSPSFNWEVACRASDSKNLISDSGKPASGFKLTSSYTNG